MDNVIRSRDVGRRRERDIKEMIQTDDHGWCDMNGLGKE